MRQLAKLLDQTIKCEGTSRVQEVQEGNLLQWGRRSRFNGLVLDGDVLVLDYRMFSSFRVKTANLPALRYTMRWYRPVTELYDRSYRTAYFADNHDNPYGLWNMLLAMGQDPGPNELTQFPPLNYPKDAGNQKGEIDRMRERSQPGDLFFTFDRTSGLSRLIRKWDRGMWSHCGMVGYGGRLYEATTSGPAESDFSRLYEPRLDVGLYRAREGMSEDAVARGIRFMKDCVRAGAPYGWYRLVRKALKKRFGVPFKRGPDDVTPADFMYSNQLTLICFA